MRQRKLDSVGIDRSIDKLTDIYFVMDHVRKLRGIDRRRNRLEIRESSSQGSMGDRRFSYS